MKKGSILFLKTIIGILAFTVLVLHVFVLPRIILAEFKSDFDYLPILLGIYLPAIAFSIALHSAWNLLGLIDRNLAFSKLSIKALRRIKYCSFIISTLYAIGLPYIFMLAQEDDAPGLALLGLIFTFGPFVIGAAAAVFQRIFQNALDIKFENELTV